MHRDQAGDVVEQGNAGEAFGLHRSVNEALSLQAEAEGRAALS